MRKKTSQRPVLYQTKAMRANQSLRVSKLTRPKPRTDTIEKIFTCKKISVDFYLGNSKEILVVHRFLFLIPH